MLLLSGIKLEFGPSFMHSELIVNPPEYRFGLEIQSLDNHQQIYDPPNQSQLQNDVTQGPESTGNQNQPSDDEDDDDGVTSEGHVLAYFDETNITISTRRRVGRGGGGIQVDFSKLMRIARKGRRVIAKRLYCSGLPTQDGFGAFSVKLCPRSSFTGGEKMVDTALTADAVEDIIKFREYAHTGTVILFTGDADLIPVVVKAIKYHWSVEVWSYRAALSNKFEAAVRSEDTSGRVRVHLLDEIYKEIVYPWPPVLVARKPMLTRVNSCSALVPYAPPLALLEAFPFQCWEKIRKIMARILAFLEIQVENILPVTVDSGCPSDADDGEEDVVKEKESGPCPHQYRCTAGGRGCRNGHSSLELEYFSRNPDPKARMFYKTRMCMPPGGDRCEFWAKGRGYMCPYAHGLREAYCFTCKGTGDHWGDRCPNKI